MEQKDLLTIEAMITNMKKEIMMQMSNDKKDIDDKFKKNASETERMITENISDLKKVVVENKENIDSLSERMNKLERKQTQISLRSQE